MGFAQRLYLAFISGCAVSIFYLHLLNGDDWLQLPGYLVCGGLFAAGVLLPWLQREDATVLRVGGLIACSSASFYLAILTAMEFLDPKMGPELEQYLAASYVGLAVVVVFATPLLRQRFTLRLVLSAMLLAPIGGLVFFTLGDGFPYNFMLCFAIWHVMAFTVLQLGYSNPVTVSLPQLSKRVWTVVLSLPFIVMCVDDLAGYLLVTQLQGRDGGVEVYDQADVHGFRDLRHRPIIRTSVCEQGCLDPLADGRFAFQEYRAKDGSYEVFFVTENTDPNCRRLGEQWTAKSDPYFAKRLSAGQGRCVTYRSFDEPYSDYLVTGDFESIDDLFGLYGVQRREWRVVRADDEFVVARGVYYRFESRFFHGYMGNTELWSSFFDKAVPRPDTAWTDAEQIKSQAVLQNVEP